MTRKVPDGPIKNKERTKRKLLDAVNTILHKEGHNSLTILNIAQAADVHRKLIYLYFGGLDGLIQAYLEEKHSWMDRIKLMAETIIKDYEKFEENEISEILQIMFDEVNSSLDIQKILLWELSEYHEKLEPLIEEREKIANELFKLTDKDFKGTEINIRAIIALQIAGIYYLSLQARSRTGTFCELDINTLKAKTDIKNALKLIIELVYKEVETRKSIKY